jgi:serine/threonine protein kinase
MNLPGYRTLDIVGKGTFGDVWRARHILTNQIVAVKKISLQNNANLADRIRKEVTICSRIDHPLIAQFFEYIETPTECYIVQEFAQGSFSNFVARHHGLSEAHCRRYFTQLLSVVEYLHQSLHVIHRDLKMENLLLDIHTNLRLIDFGLSDILHGDQILTEACGTPACAAPELIQGLGYGYQIDVWGLGIILYAMTVGSIPFYDPDVSTVLRMIVSEDLQIPDSISPTLRDLIEQLMQKDPAKRITLREIREHEWLRGNPDICHVEALKMRGHLDREVIAILQEISVDCSSLAADLEVGVGNEATTAYMILRTRRKADELNAMFPPIEDSSLVVMRPMIPQLLSSSEIVSKKMLRQEKRNRSSSVGSRRRLLRIRGRRPQPNCTTDGLNVKRDTPTTPLFFGTAAPLSCQLSFTSRLSQNL